MLRKAVRAKAEAEAKAPKKVPLSEIIKDPNKVIHCSTKEEAKALCKELGKRILRWSNGDGYDCTKYGTLDTSICYHPSDGTFGYEYDFKAWGFNIIEFSDVDLTK